MRLRHAVRSCNRARTTLKKQFQIYFNFSMVIVYYLFIHYIFIHNNFAVWIVTAVQSLFLFLKRIGLYVAVDYVHCYTVVSIIHNIYLRKRQFCDVN